MVQRGELEVVYENDSSSEQSDKKNTTADLPTLFEKEANYEAHGFFTSNYRGDLVTAVSILC